MNRNSALCTALLAAAAVAVATPAHAGFEWGADCSTGSGNFHQAIAFDGTVHVGAIPTGKRDVGVRLDSDEDVDIQLIDAETGTKIVAWPYGTLNGPDQGCTWWHGVEVCYSGYNGDGGLGHEWISLSGDTDRELIMRAYGFRAGSAEVNYEWMPTPTCNEIGSGEFTQSIAYYDTVLVGNIPVHKTGVAIELDAADGRDVDIQLYDGGEPIVQWPDGMLSGDAEESLTYRGMTITYSGYNGIDGNWGHERIQIEGHVPAELTMRAFGYEAGSADVTYEWGVGVGATCGGIGALQCDEGLFCKQWGPIGASDPAGQCHTELWCLDDATAANDCANVPHIMIPGAWTCSDEFTCRYKPVVIDRTCHTDDDDYHYVGDSQEECMVIRFDCDDDQSFFSDACGCGCKDPT